MVLIQFYSGISASDQGYRDNYRDIAEECITLMSTMVVTKVTFCTTI